MMRPNFNRLINSVSFDDAREILKVELRAVRQSLQYNVARSGEKNNRLALSYIFDAIAYSDKEILTTEMINMLSNLYDTYVSCKKEITLQDLQTVGDMIHKNNLNTYPPGLGKVIVCLSRR